MFWWVPSVHTRRVGIISRRKRMNLVFVCLTSTLNNAANLWHYCPYTESPHLPPISCSEPKCSRPISRLQAVISQRELEAGGSAALYPTKHRDRDIRDCATSTRKPSIRCIFCNHEARTALSYSKWGRPVPTSWTVILLTRLLTLLPVYYT